MSEFQEAHTVSTLKGSPPGYVGYGEGGVLTEAVRRRPYSVVLLDEVEKAHPDVLELFFQVFDKGRMEDGEGREIDFKNTIIILTTNAGTDTIMKLTADPETMPIDEGLVKALKPELDKMFKPAFLGRMVDHPVLPGARREPQADRAAQAGQDAAPHRGDAPRARSTYDEALVDAVAARCTEVESGARNVDNILTNTLLPEISTRLLEQMATGGGIGAITVGVGDDGNLTYHIARGRRRRAAFPRRSRRFPREVRRRSPGRLRQGAHCGRTIRRKTMPMRVSSPAGGRCAPPRAVVGERGHVDAIRVHAGHALARARAELRRCSASRWASRSTLPSRTRAVLSTGVVRRFVQLGKSADGLVQLPRGDRAEVLVPHAVHGLPHLSAEDRPRHRQEDLRRSSA